MATDRAIIENEFRSTRTVYALRFPETEKVYRDMLTNDMQELEARHREAWTKKQDDYHQTFFRTWEGWVEMTGLEIPYAELPNCYPSAGSSEAIREVLAVLGSSARYRPALGPLTIHVFSGEYEGYEALGKPYGLRVVKHDREWYRRSIRQYALHNSMEGDVFFISQPSSLDGNIWTGFDGFMQFLQDETPMRVALDLCYVGLVPSSKWFTPKGKPKFFKDSGLWERVDYVFMSLSKVFGVYYNRIGGVYTREPLPGLWGNMWFKNLDSLHFGQKLLESFSPFEIPDQYEDLAQQCFDAFVAQHPKTFYGKYPPSLSYPKKSDVLLLGWSDEKTFDTDLRDLHSFHQVYGRAVTESLSQPSPSSLPTPGVLQTAHMRYCLTPRLYEAMVPVEP